MEGRVLERTEFVKIWAEIGLFPCVGDKSVALGTSRLFLESGDVKDVCGQGVGRPKARAFVAAPARPNSPLPPGPVLSNSRLARAPLWLPRRWWSLKRWSLTLFPRTKEQRCSQLRGKVNMTKQQLAKLSKRTRELAQLETELEEARRLIMQPTLPNTPPPSQAPRGNTSQGQ